MAKSITDATAKIHAILESLDSEERRRVINAALILLGDQATTSTKGNSQDNNRDREDTTQSEGELPPAASRWLGKHDLSRENLENYFHFDDASVVPIELPGNGKAKREKTIHTYLIVGIAALLQSGSPTFEDAVAREQCSEFGCYDKPNHGKYLKQFGNLITGSKSTGWKLTTPGMTAAANLLKAVED